MYKKILTTSCICILVCINLNQAFVAGTCQIESVRIPALTEYIRSVDVAITELKKSGLNTANCGAIPKGALSSAERTIQTIDRAFIEIPIFDNTFLDFFYNIKLAMNGETRAPVARDGLIFNQMEQKITGALASLTNQCNLNDSTKSGFIALLQENQALENIFKQAALGTPASNYTGLSLDNRKVAEAINAGYIPTATESCKDQNGTQDPIARIMTSIEGIGAKNEGTLTDWKKAIAMFQGGGGSSSTERSIEQRKLLQAELSRQGFSPRMAQTILGNFDCFKKEVKNDSAEEAVRARIACMKNPIIGLENITLLPQRKAVDMAKTTDDRVYQVNELSREERLKGAIISMNGQLGSYRTPAIANKSAIMSNLIDIHLGLLSTVETVEKRIPIMYVNCMKAQPGITCPKP